MALAMLPTCAWLHTAIIALLFLSLASAMPTTEALGSISKRSTFHKVECVGAHDGSPGFWVCIDATWYSEYDVEVFMKVHDSNGDKSAVGGSYYLAGKSVRSDEVSEDNRLGYGKDVVTRPVRTAYPFGSSKRILEIRYQGVRWPTPGTSATTDPVIWKAVMPNPHV
ncbi:hypothetical protein LTR15_001324 [Elasticomyces elasticus]|nr:hypothetical protein LTR15_001324 [Elasticomyces elasticus]